MSTETLILPRKTVSACLRALKFTVDDLSTTLKRNGPDAPSASKVAEEMFEMQDAMKAIIEVQSTTV